ncbi:MAG: phenylalanine--tRNA ligase subunit beta, partial [Verrucomicrobiae bacterium]|nr:phenylalanine--tRNA ligase subunit beta [Verrucomicrobiae bacterium]
YRELPRFPAVVRDVAWVVDESVTHGTLMAAMERHRTNLLERIELFDIFRGGTLPTGKKSVAYSLTYRAADRTLTDREVNEAHERLVRAVQRELGCEIRERQTAAGISD